MIGDLPVPFKLCLRHLSTVKQSLHQLLRIGVALDILRERVKLLLE